MRDQDNLLDEFPVPTVDQWRAEVDRLLNGVPFAKKMFTETLEGLRVGSMATADDRPDPDWTGTLPGQAPLLRGVTAARAWLVAQEIPGADPAEYNAALRHDLERGQTAINLVLTDAGRGGTDIRNLDDLRTALQGVDLARVPILIQSGAAHRRVADDLLALAAENGLEPGALRGRLGCDPVAGLGAAGILPDAAERLYDELADLSRLAAGRAPRLRTLPVFEDPWHDGGADGALGLGLVLASALAALREMEARGLDLQEAAARVHFNLCIGSDFFLEIARLRALRVLWSRILAACGCDPAAAPATIHARTSRRTSTVLDPHVNMLRATTQAMSAVFGGAASLHVAPFDVTVGGPDVFSRRIARNVQLVLRHECRFDQVVDPAGGSWFVEKLTADVATRAWSHLQAVEAAGGMARALAAGTVQEWIETVARERAARLADRRDVMIGTNQYPDPNPMPPCTAETDGPGLPLRRDGAPFEALRARVEAVGRRQAAAGRVYCACLGDMARTMPRLEFTRRFFRTGGFEVTGDTFATTAAAAAALALRDGAGTVVLVGLDETYVELAADVVQELRRAAAAPRVMLAGTAPEKLDHDGVINLKSDVLEVLNGLAAAVGGRS